MKKIQKLLAIFLMIALLASLTGCGALSDRALEKECQEIIDNHIDGKDKEETLIVGEQIRQWGVDSESPPFFTQKVYSSDENVITISERGKVTAVGAGTAYIVVLEKMPVFGTIHTDCVKYTVHSYESVLAQTPAENAYHSDLIVGGYDTYTRFDDYYFSTDESVIRFADGTLLAVGPGQAQAIVRDGDNITVRDFTVYANAYEKYLADGSVPAAATAIAGFLPSQDNSFTLKVGQSHELEGLFIWSNNYSTDTSVAIVSEDGVITAMGEGTAFVVCASSAEYYDVYRVTVTNS